MNIKKETKQDNKFGAFGYSLLIFLFFLFINTTALYSLKFATQVLVSWITGATVWCIRILLQKKEDIEGVDKPFCWFLFLLFPIFIPLSLPIWLIPTILVISYIITIIAFGGYGKHIFNPVIVSVIFMLYSYGNTGIVESSCPFSESTNGYTLWSSGIPPKMDIRTIFSEIPIFKAVELSIKGIIPSIPGSCYATVILIISYFFSILFKRRQTWLISSTILIIIFAKLFPQPPNYYISPTNILFMGIIPSLLLCGISDIVTIPESIKEQIIYSFIFSFFAIIILYNSSNILAPTYAYLLMQIFSPLITDILKIKNNEKEQ